MTFRSKFMIEAENQFEEIDDGGCSTVKHTIDLYVVFEEVLENNIVFSLLV